MYLIRSPAGLKLQWYHSTGMMVIDTDISSNKLPIKGLCGKTQSQKPSKWCKSVKVCSHILQLLATLLFLSGFCDGDPANDLMLPNGTTLVASEDPVVFIDSWQVPNTTSYVSHSRRRELNCSTSDCSTCLVMLQNPTFLPCHDFVRNAVLGPSPSHFFLVSTIKDISNI